VAMMPYQHIDLRSRWFTKRISREEQEKLLSCYP
jgi:hypothetical protein